MLITENNNSLILNIDEANREEINQLNEAQFQKAVRKQKKIFQQGRA